MGVCVSEERVCVTDRRPVQAAFPPPHPMTAGTDPPTPPPPRLPHTTQSFTAAPQKCEVTSEPQRPGTLPTRGSAPSISSPKHTDLDYALTAVLI